MAETRHFVLVLGDQLDLDATAFDGFDAARAVFEPDAITREVIALVEARFATHPAGWTTSPGR